MTSFDVHDARARFPALAGDAVFFDAPGGSQVPASVTDAISTVLRETTANLGGVFATSVRTAQIVEQAHAAAGRFLGCDAGETIFGLNMTSLNFALTRALGRTLRRGDEILVTRLDHDANVAPWLELADDHGLQVRMVDIDPVDATLDFDDLAAKLGPRTRVVACNWASNACGTLTDVGRVSEMAHAAGALCWVDATHAAAHEPIDVRATGIDVLLCSPYKVCGPHLGLAYGRAAVLGEWRPYKVRPAPNDPIGRRFESGTMPYEQLAGFVASVEYLEEIGGLGATLAHTQGLGERLLAGLPPRARIIGRPGMSGRVPTFLMTFDGLDAAAVCDALVADGFYVTASDSFYCLGLKERVGFDKALRVGLVHYHLADEVDALLGSLARIAE